VQNKRKGYYKNNRNTLE